MSNRSDVEAVDALAVKFKELPLELVIYRFIHELAHALRMS